MRWMTRRALSARRYTEVCRVQMPREIQASRTPMVGRCRFKPAHSRVETSTKPF